MKEYMVVSNYYDFDEDNIRQIELMFKVAMKKSKSFNRPENWVREMLLNGAAIAIKSMSGEILSSMFLLPVAEPDSKTATVQAAIWRSREAAVANWKRLISIAGKNFDKVYCAMHKSDDIANFLIMGQKGTRKISGCLAPKSVKEALSFNDKKHFLYIWELSPKQHNDISAKGKIFVD